MLRRNVDKEWFFLFSLQFALQKNNATWIFLALSCPNDIMRGEFREHRKLRPVTLGSFLGNWSPIHWTLRTA